MRHSETGSRVLVVGVVAGVLLFGCASTKNEPRPVVRFVDITRASGLTLPPVTANDTARLCYGGKRVKANFPKLAGPPSDSVDTQLCQNERMSGGAAVADVNGDGALDVYVTRLQGPGALFRNRGNGTFENVTAASGLGVLAEPSVGALFADIDNDGDEDLMVTTLSSRRFYLFVNNGKGHFTEEGRERGFALDNGSAHMGMSIAAGDYDHDGYLDLFTTEWRPVAIGAAKLSDARLLHNDGRAHPGYFEDATARAGVSLVEPLNPAWSFSAQFTDLDGDGWPDLAITSDFATSRLFWNRGNGTFVDGTRSAGVGTDENGMGSTIADYDGDGRPDWFVTGIFSTKNLCDSKAPCGFGQTGNRLYRNVGNRRFDDATDAAGVRDGGWGWGAAFVDGANSGRLDLVMAGGFDFTRFPKYKVFAAGPMHYWQATGHGSFTDITASTGLDARDGKGLAVFDADGDGRLDVLVVSPGGSPHLFRNESPVKNHWLRVGVTGFTSNRDGLGAVVSVRVHANDPAVQREIGSTTGFLGQSERDAQFGLGSFTGRVAEVRVRWPATGRENVLHNVKIDETIHVTEPAG